MPPKRLAPDLLKTSPLEKRAAPPLTPTPVRRNKKRAVRQATTSTAGLQAEGGDEVDWLNDLPMSDDDDLKSESGSDSSEIGGPGREEAEEAENEIDSDDGLVEVVRADGTIVREKAPEPPAKDAKAKARKKEKYERELKEKWAKLEEDRLDREAAGELSHARRVADGLPFENYTDDKLPDVLPPSNDIGGRFKVVPDEKGDIVRVGMHLYADKHGKGTYFKRTKGKESLNADGVEGFSVVAVTGAKAKAKVEAKLAEQKKKVMDMRAKAAAEVGGNEGLDQGEKGGVGLAVGGEVDGGVGDQPKAEAGAEDQAEDQAEGVEPEV